VASVAFVLHHQHPEARRLAAEVSEWLLERGHTVRLPAGDAVLAGLEDLACTDADLTRDLDLAVSLGGDGTMLRAVDLVADDQVPVLGVNLGQLGYLAEIEPSGLPEALEAWLAGRCFLEERMRLAVEVDAPSWAEAGPTRYPALNEAVLGKSPMGQIVRLAVEVDGERFATYSADGVIVATPTGSTAYAWSAGGPIVAPDHAALLLTPVAPHMLFDRTLLLGPTAAVRLVVASDRPATLAVDGRDLGLLERGDAVTCTAATQPARLVVLEPRSFLTILKAKFDLGRTPGE
jgi:NAD+ kinase